MIWQITDKEMTHFASRITSWAIVTLVWYVMGRYVLGWVYPTVWYLETTLAGLFLLFLIDLAWWISGKVTK